MELKWLEDFVTLAETASFSRAAVLRHVTQSAFSRRIKQLESWVGAPLISRATIPAELTAEGRAFLPLAHETIRTFQAARDALRPAGRLAEQRLTLASLHTLAVTMMPEWIERIDAGLPGLRTALLPDRGGIEANLDALVGGEADLLSTYAHPYVPMLLDPDQFDWIGLGHDTILPVAAPRLRHFEGPQPEGSADVLAQAAGGGWVLPMLDHGAASFIGTALSRHEGYGALAKRVVHENSISVGLREFALRGWGLCWLPESLVRADLAAGRLVAASPDPAWRLDVEIRLYRYRSDENRDVDALWPAIVEALAVREGA